MATKKVYDSDEILKIAAGGADTDVETDKTVKNNSVNIGSTGTSTNSASDDWFKTSNAYQKQADAIYEQIQSTPDFKYDFNEDAVFQALKEQYIKDGKLAAENVAGQAAALSGGYGNSYGTVAAGQAYMGAIDDLYNVISELQENAYARYQNEKADALSNWQILQNRADTEREYAQNERAYQDSKAALSWEQALQQAELGDYSALKVLGVDTSNSEYESNLGRALALAELGDYSALKALGIDTSNSEYESNLSRALALAEVGDYSALKALGVDTSNSEYELNFNKALALAELGDYSALKKLGVDTSSSEYALNLNNALALAELGDYSALKALGVDVSSAEKQNTLDFALAAAEVGDYSFLKALGIDTSAMYSSSGSSGNGGGNDDSGNNDNKKKEENDVVAPKNEITDREQYYIDLIASYEKALENSVGYTAAEKRELRNEYNQLKKEYKKEFGK